MLSVTVELLADISDRSKSAGSSKQTYEFTDLSDAVEYISVDAATQAISSASEDIKCLYGDIIKDAVDLTFRYIDAYEYLHPDDTDHFNKHPLTASIDDIVRIFCGSTFATIIPMRYKGQYSAITYSIQDGRHVNEIHYGDHISLR